MEQCQQVLSDGLNRQWISVKFVPQVLTDEQKHKQFLAVKNMAVVPSFLTGLIWPLVISSCFQE